MKCPNCGANLTIDDEVCSFCGEENPYAEKHREEMRHFTRDFKRTQSQVLETTRSHSKFVAKITLIAVMVVLNLVLWIMVDESYTVEKFVMNRRISADYLLHKAEMDKLEEERNFIGFYVYYNENRLNYCDLFEEYQAAYNVSNNYEIVYNYMMELLTEESESSYYTDEKKAEMLAQQLDFLYKYSKPREYSDMTQYSKKHQEFMDAAVTQIEDLLHTYIRIPKEEMDKFRELSIARKQIMLEEGLGINE